MKKLLLLLVAFALPALAQHQMPQGADPSAFKPLPERKDVRVLEAARRRSSW